MTAANQAGAVGSDPFVAALVAILVLVAGRRVIRHVARVELDPRLVTLLTLSLVIHLLCAPGQIFVVDHVYHGVADFNRYVDQGARLASNFRAGHFTLAGSGVKGILGDGMTSIISGIVMTILGPNKLAEFFLFAGLSFFGDVCFYRAFSVTFPGADRRRYALFLFFLPSLLFWTADMSKESVMTLALGLVAYGAARVLARLKRGYPLIVLGSIIAIGVRPNELVLLLVGFAVAMFFRSHDPSRKLRGTRRVLTIAFVGIALGVSAYLTQRFLHGYGSISNTLQQIGKNNSGTGAGFGSSNVAYSSNPLYYPRDLYTVLFDPLPISAHGSSQLLQAAENTVILVLVLKSLRQLRYVFRVSRWKPYVIICAIYSALFLYAFASLGNLGLITRERALLLPFLLVLFAIPLSPKRGPSRYPWERRVPRRRDRARHVITSPRRAITK